MADHTADTGVLLPVASGRAVAVRLWQMLAGRHLRLSGILVLFLIEASTALVFPLVIGSMVDTVIAGNGEGVPGAFWWQILLLAAAAVIAGLMAWIAAFGLARLAETVIAELRESYVTAALELPRSTIEEAGTGDVVTRASDDIAQVSGTLPEVLPRLCVSMFTIVLVAAGLASLDPWYLAGFALTVPFYAITVQWYLRTAPAVYAAERRAQSVRGQDILGTLTHLPTVTAHRLEQRQLARIRDATWQTVRWAMRTRIVQNRLFGQLNITEALGLFAVLGVGIVLALNGSTTAGQATAAALLFLRTVAPIQALLFIMDDVQSALAALGRLIGITTAQAPGKPQNPGKHTDPADPHDQYSPRSGTLVELDDVHFAYRQDRPVLTAVDTQIEHRTVLAVVGTTGSGKSTLASLVAGVHRPTEGRVTRRIDPEQIVTVTQETHVFIGTVRENLTLALPGATEEQVSTALKKVGAEYIIQLLPEGLDTHVGVGGHAVTTAHAQHLALARIALADPELVILDEATAEADAADTTMLDRATEAVVEDRAALVIAHRLTQAQAADRIIVLDRGRVIEEGKHHDLVTRRGTYARLWKAWSAPSG